jgi:hypothetical protein
MYYIIKHILHNLERTVATKIHESIFPKPSFCRCFFYSFVSKRVQEGYKSSK